MPRVWDWSRARTVLVAAGLPFAAVSLGAACLDYAGEDFERTCASEATASASTGSGSGSGSGSAGTPSAADCGVPPKTGSGSGSAAPAQP